MSTDSGVAYITPSDPADAQRTILGMKAKLERHKRFLSKYRANLTFMEEQSDRMARVARENRKLRIAISEIALARKGTTSVSYLARYARKVLDGLGYTDDAIAHIAGRFF